MDEFRKISLAVGRNSDDLITALEDALLRNDYERLKEFGVLAKNAQDVEVGIKMIADRTSNKRKWIP